MTDKDTAKMNNMQFGNTANNAITEH